MSSPSTPGVDAVGHPGPDPDRRHLIAVAVQFWINGMVYAAVIPRLPDVRDRLGIGVGTLGLLLAASSVLGLIGSFLAGPVIARLGTRRAIVVSTIGALTVLPLIGFVRSPVAFVALFGVVGLLDVVVDISMNLQGSWLSARRATPVMNRLHALWSVGTVTGGMIAARALAAGVPLRTHLLGVSAVLALALAVTGSRLLPVDPEHGHGDPDGEPDTGDEPGAGGRGGAPTGGGREPGVRQAGILVLALLGATAVAMELTTSDWAAFRLADDLQASPGRIGLGFVAFTAGMVTGRLSGDLVQARLGTSRLVRIAGAVAASGLAVATLGPAGRPSPTGALVLSIAGYYVAALGVSVVFPQLYDAAARAPGRAGRGLAFLTAGTRMATLSTPVIVGVVAGTSLAVGTAVALVTIPCALVVLLVAPRYLPRGR